MALRFRLDVDVEEFLIHLIEHIHELLQAEIILIIPLYEVGDLHVLDLEVECLLLDDGLVVLDLGALQLSLLLLRLHDRCIVNDLVGYELLHPVLHLGIGEGYDFLGSLVLHL